MDKLKKITNIKKGFTLVEIIVALALLVIISTAFLAMFLFGFSNIANSGKNSKSQYNAQTIIESNISDIANTSPNLTRTPTSTIKLYKSGAFYKSITGEKIVVSYPYGSSIYKITTFIGN